MRRVKNCHILEMLLSQKRPHLSFHTPGHKRAGADITELCYSDNLLSPHGVIAHAEEDIAKIVGAHAAFLLTDGSTSGVHAMLLTLREAGITRIAYPKTAHKSVKDACWLFGLTGVEIAAPSSPYPKQPSIEAIEGALANADALLLTSPDYYGNFPPLKEAAALCEEQGKPFVIDGAHGAHLHGTPLYAGNFAEMWVDGAHKSLPALTQGAAVFARDELWAKRLKAAVSRCRTTSPSYPVMASVEYAYKYPKNEKIERAAEALKREINAEDNADWTKILVPFGSECARAEEFLQKKGVWAEFNDGNFLMFYLSPCTKAGALRRLKALLKRLPRGPLTLSSNEEGARGKRTRLVPLKEAEGLVSARECGLFPPCVPLISEGERITKEHIARLSAAANTFGLEGGNILVFEEDA